MRESKKKQYAEFVRNNSNPNSSAPPEKIEFEQRPGGMLVQKRDENAEQGLSGPLIRVRVSFGAVYHEVNICAYSTFGDLKKALVNATGLQAKEQRILYRGKEKESGDYLHLVGVKDKAKVVLIEDPESRERKLVESQHNERVNRSARAVSAIKAEVDNLAERVLILETDVHNKSRVPESEFEALTEKLMMQLLKLDGIEAFGDAKTQRRIQVRRVQKFVEALDVLKVKNSNPGQPNNSSISKVNPAAVIQATTSPVLTKSVSNTSVVTTKWETFDNHSNVNSVTTAPPSRPITTAIETHWERALFSSLN